MGGDRGPGARRHDGAAHHAVPRGGRSPGPRHRGDRPRTGHRRGHAGSAQGRPGDLGRLGDPGQPGGAGPLGRAARAVLGQGAGGRRPRDRADRHGRAQGRRRRPALARRGTHPHRRARPQGAQPRRRVLEPDRAQDHHRRGRRGHGQAEAGPGPRGAGPRWGPTGRMPHDDDDHLRTRRDPRVERRRRQPPVVGRGRHRDHDVAQPARADPHARGGLLHHVAADHVRAALHLRVRRRHPGARWALHPVPDARHLRADGRLRGHEHRRSGSPRTCTRG